MLKRLLRTAGLVGLMLAGSVAAADNPNQSALRQLRSNFGLVVESSARDSQDEGVTVLEVLPGSLAERAGLREGDVILRVGSRSIERFRDLVNALRGQQLGERVSIRVERDGRSQNLRLALRRMDGDEEDRESPFRYGRANDNGNGEDGTFQRLQQRFRRLESRLQEMERQGQYGQERGESAEQSRDYRQLHRRLDELEERVQQASRSGQYGRSDSGMTLGVQVRQWRRQADSRQGGSAEEGMEVTAVEPDSPAAEAGLRRGDIIIRVDDRDVSSRQELRQAWQRIGAGKDATLEILRGSRQMMRNVRMEGGSRYGARDRRYERLQERIEQLENRLREMEQNQ